MILVSELENACIKDVYKLTCSCNEILYNVPTKNKI